MSNVIPLIRPPKLAELGVGPLPPEPPQRPALRTDAQAMRSFESFLAANAKPLREYYHASEEWLRITKQWIAPVDAQADFLAFAEVIFLSEKERSRDATRAFACSMPTTGCCWRSSNPPEARLRAMSTTSSRAHVMGR